MGWVGTEEGKEEEEEGEEVGKKRKSGGWEDEGK